jgi:methionyl-tRNA formyltransferase
MQRSRTRWAKEKETPHIDPRDDFMGFIKRQPCDYLFSIVNGHILPDEVLGLPRKHAINDHNALLSLYAGSHATTWAIMEGKKVHRVTWHIMSDLVDAGIS